MLHTAGQLLAGHLLTWVAPLSYCKLACMLEIV